MKNNFMMYARLHHRIFGKLFRFFRLHHTNQGTPDGFRKTISKKRGFSTTPRHPVHHTIHHPLTRYHSIITGLLHAISKEKKYNIYMFLNAYIGLYIKETPWAPLVYMGRNMNFFPEF